MPVSFLNTIIVHHHALSSSYFLSLAAAMEIYFKDENLSEILSGWTGYYGGWMQ